MKLKEAWRKFWFMVWKDDSLKGWLFSIVFLFVFIKFIFFPFLSLLTGTALPLAIVESCSMYHDGNILSDFDGWWQMHEEKYSGFAINKTEFREFKMKNGFNKGDILFVTGAKPKNLNVGDIIIFNRDSGNPIIHRIVSIKEEDKSLIFSTKGDNNNGQLSVEKEISESQIVGKASLKVVPYLGWVKLIFFENSKPVSERGFCTAN